MRKLLAIILAIFVGISAAAQNDFSYYILSGDAKMQEQMYDMAMTYYNKALNVASSSSEISLAQSKINTCKREKSKGVSSTSKHLFSDTYLETGDVYDPSSNTVIPAVSDDGFYTYSLDVYTDHIVVKEDQSSEEVIFKKSKETENYRIFTSDDRQDYFYVFKTIKKNSYGRYRPAWHVVGSTRFILYSSYEVQQLMSDSNKTSSVNSSDVKKRAKVEKVNADSLAVAKKELLVKFKESWAQNMNSDNELLGDTRREPMRARNIRFLLFRVKYECPAGYIDTLRFGIKIYDPSGTLLQTGDSTSYTQYEYLKTLSSGGIFNFAIGDPDPGSFVAGDYRFEIWYEGSLCYSSVISLS